MCFKTYLNHHINKKKVAKKNNLKAITVLKKRGGGGPARYDHDLRFKVFFLMPSLSGRRQLFTTLNHKGPPL